MRITVVFSYATLTVDINYYVYISIGCLEKADWARRILQFVERLYSLLCSSWSTHCTHFHIFGTVAQILL